MTDEEIKLRLYPMKAIKYELGGDYYYKCPYIKCGVVVRSDQNYCGNCGQKLVFEEDSYTRRDYGKVY